MTLEKILAGLRDSPYVREKELGNNISSFNFTRKAFWKRHWTDMSVKARGLFIDTENMRVKARSYDKFFHLGERRETELDYIAENWKYPIAAYVKENGYLGICSWNEDGTLFCASKSTTEGIYAERFREILESTLADKVEDFSNRLKKENLSAIFEVIDPEYDSHIVMYSSPEVVLLDLVYNEWEPGDLEFLNKSYEVLQSWGIKYNLAVKDRSLTFWNAEELKSFCKSVPSKNFTPQIEGFVLEDMNMNHVKLKTDYYNYWKSWRPVIAAVRKGNEVRYDKIDFVNHPESSYILWLIDTFASHYYAIHEKDLPIVNLQKLYKAYNNYVLE